MVLNEVDQQGVSPWGIAKPRHTKACARATFACALAFTCHSFKSAPCVKESACNQKRCESSSQH